MLTTRDRVLQDAAREVLAQRSIRCRECGQHFIGLGEFDTRWYRAGEHVPPYGDPRRWCGCGRALPSPW